MLKRIIELFLILLIIFCISLILYPTLINKYKKEDLLLTEKNIRKNYKESVIVYCEVEKLFEVRNLEINYYCEVQDFSMSPAKIYKFLCKKSSECELKP